MFGENGPCIQNLWPLSAFYNFYQVKNLITSPNSKHLQTAISLMLKWDNSSLIGLNTKWKKEKMLVPEFSRFPTMF